MKIKIIDLLNIIANGEEVPKKIKYRDKIWEYASTVLGRGYQHYSECWQDWKTLQSEVYLEECLNDEVEIIEEPKKIEKAKIKFFEETGEAILSPRIEEYNENNFKELKRVTDELIEEINKLKEND